MSLSTAVLFFCSSSGFVQALEASGTAQMSSVQRCAGVHMNHTLLLLGSITVPHVVSDTPRDRDELRVITDCDL